MSGACRQFSTATRRACADWSFCSAFLRPSGRGPAPRLLAARERPDRFDHALAAEVEAAEEVAHRGLAHVRIEALNVRERGKRRHQLLELVLREVADLEVRIAHHRAAARRE